MLQTFYNNFGFVGSLAIAFGGFMFVVFWMSGIAGICYEENGRYKTARIILSALFPPYPFFWVLYDMYEQRKRMKEE
ncbi:MAG: hypothetical protein R3224_08025 [Balneolaceae bacterium]|nr:hypothetical protein [Balneolaceae bacterium]